MAGGLYRARVIHAEVLSQTSQRELPPGVRAAQPVRYRLKVHGGNLFPERLDRGLEPLFRGALFHHRGKFLAGQLFKVRAGVEVRFSGDKGVGERHARGQAALFAVRTVEVFVYVQGIQL